MGILASDTFKHPDQSGWPVSSGGQTWTAPRGAGTYSIVSDEGVNSANGGTFSVARIGSGDSANQEIDVRLKPADTTSNIGAIGRYIDANNFYYGVLAGGAAVIGKDVAGSFTTIASAPFSYSASNFYQLKFNLVETTLKLKAWQDGTSEPGSWTVTTSDSSIASGGYGLGSDATGSTSFDSLTVTDAAASLSVTCSGSGTLTGTLSLVADLVAEAECASSLSAALSLATELAGSIDGTGALSGTLSFATALTGTLVGISSLSSVLSAQIALIEILAGTGALAGTLAFTVALSAALAGFGTLTLMTQQAPGVATISDAERGSASIGDALVDQASSSDAAVGSVTISDQG